MRDEMIYGMLNSCHVETRTVEQTPAAPDRYETVPGGVTRLEAFTVINICLHMLKYCFV